MTCITLIPRSAGTVELQRRLSRSDSYRHVIVHGCHPGFIKSNIWNNPSIKKLPWPLPQLLNFVINLLSVNTFQGSLAILHSALRPDLGLPRAVVETAKTGQPPVLAMGESIKYGGRFVNRVTASWMRPECADPLVRARLWQRVLEDLKADKSRGQDEIAQDLPSHSPGLLEVEKS